MSGPSFRIAGIPVRIDLTFFLLAFLLGWGARSGALLVAWLVIVTVSVLLHELGHAFAFRRYGQEPQILLQGMGGLTSGSGEPLAPRRDIFVSLAGPLTGILVLGLPALFLARSTSDLSPDWETVLADIVFVNIAWSIVNLLPILPLDGGRVSAALLSMRSGGRGDRPAHLLSAVVAGAGGLWALTAGYPFAGLFAGFFVAYNLSQLSAARNAGLEEQLLGGWRSLGTGDPGAAASAARAVLNDRPSGPVMAQATELLAWARLTEGDRTGAEEALRRMPHGTEPGEFLRAALELEAGRTEEAVEHVVTGYTSRRLSPGAAVVAAGLARLGRTDDVIARLLASGEDAGSAAGLFAVHLHAAGHYEDAARAGRRAFEWGPGDPGRVAYNLACSLARSDDSEGALEWLERAVDLGFDDRRLIEADPDLERLRSGDRFQALQRRLERPAGEASPGTTG